MESSNEDALLVQLQARQRFNKVPEVTILMNRFHFRTMTALALLIALLLTSCASTHEWVYHGNSPNWKADIFFSDQPIGSDLKTGRFTLFYTGSNPPKHVSYQLTDQSIHETGDGMINDNRMEVTVPGPDSLEKPLHLQVTVRWNNNKEVISFEAK